MGLEEADWGKMSVMTVGTFQVFVKNVTLTCVLHVKTNVFPKNCDFHFLCLSNLFLLGGQICEVFSFLEYRI